MQNFVQRGGGIRKAYGSSKQPKKIQSLDDLKQNIPSPDSQRAQDSRENRPLPVEDNHPEDLNQAQPFYATGLGSSLTSPSVEFARRNSSDRLPSRPEHEAIDEHNVNPDEYAEDPFHDTPNNATGELADLEGRDVQLDVRNGGFVNRYMVGDSFPDTTSGRLSMLDEETLRDRDPQLSQTMEHYHDQRSKNHLQYNTQTSKLFAAPEPLPTNESSKRETYGFARTNIYQPEKIQQVMPPATLPSQSPAGFQFARHSNNPTSTYQLSKAQPALYNNAGMNNPTPPVQHGLAQRGMSGYNRHNQASMPIPSSFNPQQPKSGKAKATLDIQGIHNMVKRGKTPVPIINQPIEPVESSKSDELIDSINFYGSQNPDSFFDDAEADVDNELLDMNYEDLKSVSFGLERGLRKGPEGTDETMSLSTRLGHAVKMTVQDQHKFFVSLSEEKWEETGDWFIDRFGELVGKMKAARQERRNVGQQFMAEVDQRHEMVVQKREQTERALAEMKESGARMLQSTPKGRKTA